MKLLRPLTIAMLGLSVWCTQAQAEEFTFTGNETRPPKVFNDPAGNANGVLVEIMKFVGKETGDKYNFKLFPWARAYDTALKGEMAIIGLSKNTERLALFDYSEEPLFYDDLILVVKKGKEFSFENVSDLKGKKIGTARGASYGDIFEKAIKENVFEAVAGNTPSSQLGMLLLDRLDAVLISVGKAGLEEACKDKTVPTLQSKKDQLVILPKPFNRDPNYVAFAKTMGKKEYLNKIDQVLKKANKSGELNKIIDKFISVK